MTGVLAVIVDLQELGYTVVASIVAATVLTTAVSLAIRGVSRYAYYSQQGRSAAAYSSLVLVGVSLLATLALIGLGLYVMVNS